MQACLPLKKISPSLSGTRQKRERSLVLNGAGAGGGKTNLIALMEGEDVIACEVIAGRGASELFAPTVQKMLAGAGWHEALDQVIVVVGPGSFTGLRASISLAAGLARGWGCPVKGIRLGDALRETAHAPQAVCLCLARRGRVFIDSPEQDVWAASFDDLADVNWSVLMGDAVYGENALAECIGENGIFLKPEIQILPFAAPDAPGIYRASCLREIYPLKPLYIDPPEARLPARGLRSSPI